MAIYLKDLSARAPLVHDLQAITELINICERAEHGVSDYTQDDVLATWHKATFELRTDAWVIIAKGRLVGYACVWQEEDTDLAMKIVVHPDYQGRGIGTLLLRLAEQRARTLALLARSEQSITLRSTVSQSNERATQLLEHEGYNLTRHFWHIAVEVDEATSSVSKQRNRHGKLKVALDIDTRCLNNVAELHEREGLYVIRQYAAFEKLLREGKTQPVTEQAANQLMLV